MSRTMMTLINLIPGISPIYIFNAFWGTHPIQTHAILHLFRHRQIAGFPSFHSDLPWSQGNARIFNPRPSLWHDFARIIGVLDSEWADVLAISKAPNELLEKDSSLLS